MSVTTSAHIPALRLWGVRVPRAMLVGVVCLAVAGLADAVLAHERGISGDEPYYVRMAAHPGGPHTYGYAYRIAVPWLVHALPFRQVVSWQLQALVLIAASGAALYVLLRTFAVSPWLAGGLAVGLAVSPTLLVALLRHGRSVDPATTLVMMLGCLFIVRRQRLALALTMLIGVAVKETSLFLIPLAYAVWAQRPVDVEALRDVARVSVAAVAVAVALRLEISAMGVSSYTPGIAGSFFHVRLEVLRKAFSGTALKRLAYTYGPLWIVAPLALRQFSFPRRGLALVGVCVLALCVVNDAQRVVFLAAPVFFVSAALVLKHRRYAALAAVIALLAVDTGYAVYMQVHGVKYGLDQNAPGANPVY